MAVTENHLLDVAGNIFHDIVFICSNLCFQLIDGRKFLFRTDKAEEINLHNLSVQISGEVHNIGFCKWTVRTNRRLYSNIGYTAVQLAVNVHYRRVNTIFWHNMIARETWLMVGKSIRRPIWLPCSTFRRIQKRLPSIRLAWSIFPSRIAWRIRVELTGSPSRLIGSQTFSFTPCFWAISLKLLGSFRSFFFQR